MDSEPHGSKFLSTRIDWNNFIAYAEMADIDMDIFKQGEAETSATPQMQNMSTFGLKMYTAKNTPQ